LIRKCCWVLRSPADQRAWMALTHLGLSGVRVALVPSVVRERLELRMLTWRARRPPRLALPPRPAPVRAGRTRPQALPGLVHLRAQVLPLRQPLARASRVRLLLPQAVPAGLVPRLPQVWLRRVQLPNGQRSLAWVLLAQALRVGLRPRARMQLRSRVLGEPGLGLLQAHPLRPVLTRSWLPHVQPPRWQARAKTARLPMPRPLHAVVPPLA